CCRHASGAAEHRAPTGHRRTLPVADAVLPAAVRHRAEDQLRRGRRGDSALHGHLRLRRPAAAGADQPRQLHLPQRGQPLLGGLCRLAEDRLLRHPAVPADRLPDGLRHRPRAQGPANRAAAADHDADLDGHPDPRLCLDGHPQQQRPAQQPAAGDGPDRHAAEDPQHRSGGVHRRGLFLPAVHDPATLRQPGEARPEPAGGRVRPGRSPPDQFLEDHRAAVEERHHRRLHAGVHPGGGRIRDSRTARRTRDADDRQGALAGVLQQPRLAGGGLAGGGDAGDPADSDNPLQQEPGQGIGGQTMKRYSFSNLILVLGLVFIYLPMVILVIYSFNASRLVTVWGGWSLKWYIGLLDNTQLMGAVMRSLEIALYTAIAAVALGTMAAFVLTRIPVFRGRTLFGGLVTAPLVMPEVITGLSLLLLCVAMAQLIGWPAQRGIVTIWIAHTTFCSSYVAIVVMARLRELDLSIEEAAMDLGA